jgi:SAM-dependent MidA family methyltransferase
MPARRLGWDAKNKRWFEWGVALKDGQFVWAIIQQPASRIIHPALPEALLDVLPDGFTTEMCPAADTWWREAARMLRRGKLLTIDYGFNAEGFIVPERSEGTLRAYYRHRLSKDLLANAGAQDLTAHVNFTALQAAGEATGLKTEQFETQAEFLTQLAGRIWRRRSDFGEWTSARTRQFQTLTHPEHLGRPFRVLIQSRG